MPLMGEDSLLAETAARAGDPALYSPPYVICNGEHRFLVAEHLRRAGHKPEAILLEPVGRNTAPAATLAALKAAEQDPDSLLLMMPSDHHVGDPEAFRAAVEAGARAAAAGWLVVFGVVPTRPDTGYGYIKQGEALADQPGLKEVARFVEKPDAETATAYLADGGYFWNSGMALFSARRLLDEMAARHPELLAGCRQALAEAKGDLDFLRLAEAPFAALPNLSLDYGLLEVAERVAVVPARFGWADLGTWNSLWQVGRRDEEGNVRQGDVMTFGARNSYLHTDDRLLAAVDVEDLVVVVTDDAVLVCRRDSDQGVRDVVKQLAALNRSEAQHHRQVFRPWGYYHSIAQGPGFQVKRLMLHPGATISLQRHRHRAEHWVVVAGEAEVTRDGEVTRLQVNHSTFIPQGCIHRLANPGREPLQVIEVQSGSYLGEDDIERFEDIYNRA